MILGDIAETFSIVFVGFLSLFILIAVVYIGTSINLIKSPVFLKSTAETPRNGSRDFRTALVLTILSFLVFGLGLSITQIASQITRPSWPGITRFLDLDHRGVRRARVLIENLEDYGEVAEVENCREFQFSEKEYHYTSLGAEVFASSYWMDLAKRSLLLAHPPCKMSQDKFSDHVNSLNYQNPVLFLNNCRSELAESRKCKEEYSILIKYIMQLFYIAKHKNYEHANLFAELSEWEKRTDYSLSSYIVTLCGLALVAIVLVIRLVSWTLFFIPFVTRMPGGKTIESWNNSSPNKLITIGILACLVVSTVGFRKSFDLASDGYNRRVFGFFITKLQTEAIKNTGAKGTFVVNSKTKTDSLRTVAPAVAEREDIACLAVAALIDSNWQGPNVDYRRGHNIAALIIHKDRPALLSAGLNSNHACNRSTRHAEMNALESAFEALHKRGNNEKYNRVLKNYTIVTSLEPCSMCAGALDLANLKKIIFLQKDASQYSISQRLRTLHGKGAPIPMQCNIQQAHELDKKFNEWLQINGNDSVTDFLRTGDVRRIYKSAKDQLLNEYQIKYQGNRDFYNEIKSAVTNTLNKTWCQQ
ncbi:MAG: nucleoside deaminase [Proteobacteria bacterium]|nr:nucleoside deaminase [Pseudomonadota bacterium]